MVEKHIPADTYVISQTPAEAQRLQLQSRFLNPFLHRLFDQVGITSGMNVLDVGSGAGDVALLLAERVGPGGKVVGVDSNPVILETARARVAAAGYNNVSFLVGNLANIVLDTMFDAIVGRFVLAYLPDPAAVLRRLSSFLHPEGIVAFQDYDTAHYTTTAVYPPNRLHNQVLAWQEEALRRAGTHMRMGMDMYTAFLDAGLPAPQMHGDVVIIPGPDPLLYHWRVASTRAVLPLILKFGIATEEEVGIDTLEERLREEAARHRLVIQGPFVVSAWTTLEKTPSSLE